MTKFRSQELIALASLLVALVSMLVAGAQTYVLWQTRDRSIEAGLYVTQLEACAKLVEGYQRYSNANAEWRFSIGVLESKPASGIKDATSDKANIPKEKLEELVVLKRNAMMKAFSETHLLGFANIHLFEPKTRMLISEMQNMLMPLALATEGNQNARPEDFNSRLDALMLDCRNISDQFQLNLNGKS